MDVNRARTKKTNYYTVLGFEVRALTGGEDSGFDFVRGKLDWESAVCSFAARLH